MKYDKLNVAGFVFDFDGFVPSDENPVPVNRIMDFLTVGPFVLATDGSFEAEHMYEREKLLLEDYLAADGGEKNITPVLGQNVRNEYYGDEYLKWEKGFIKWNSLRFDRDEDACDPALFATEQRNAVYYAAFYVDCKKKEKAIISYENSGSSLFVNGELVDFRPFGRVKGLNGLGFQCLVEFRKGRNLVVFKLRPGYIADTMDISMPTCVVYPVITEIGGLCFSAPSATRAFCGTQDSPRMISHIFAVAGDDTREAVISCDENEEKLMPMKKGETAVLHIGVSAGKVREIKRCEFSVSCGGKTEKTTAYFETEPYDGFDGREHITSDFHFDTTYHQEQRTYAMGAFHITKSIIENLESNPDFKAVLSEIDYLHPYYSLYPHHRKALKDAFSSGRAEADCFYNQPNDLTSSGEAFVRNLVYGQLYHRDVLGRISRVYAPGDVFGHFSQITQVCKKGGCDMVRWGKCMLGVDALFRHVSPDGSVLLHDKGTSRFDANRFGVKGCQHSSEALSYIEAYPRCGDTEWMKNTLSHASFSVYSDLADDIIESDNKNARDGSENLIDYTSRDITQHHSGVLLTRTEFKQANRLCENLLVSAEKFAAIAFLYGAKYPEKALDKSWRQLLCAQHHDSITGTNNEISFVDLMIEYRESASLAYEVLMNSARYIASIADVGSRDNALFVFNPASRDSNGICRFELPDGFSSKYAAAVDTKGREYPVRIEGKKACFTGCKIPATGYSLLRLEPRDEDPAPLRIGNDTVIENEYFRLAVDKINGGIVSLFDKKAKKECIDMNAPSTANAIYALHEIHNRMETQHELYTDGLKLVSDEFIADIVSEKCKAYQKLTVSSKLGTLARVIREITLRKSENTVEFRTVIEDYNSEDELFCAAFPMNIKGGAVIYDDRFAPHISTRSKKYMSFQTHQYASFSGCRVLPSNRWFGIGPSVTVKMKNGSVNIGMTALIRRKERVCVENSDKLLKALSKKAIPVTPYPDEEQHGGNKIIHFNEDIYETDTRFVVCLAGDGNKYKEKLLSSAKKSIKTKAERSLAEKGYSAIYFRDSDNAYKKPVDVFLITAQTENDLKSFIDELCLQLSKGRELKIDCIEADIPEKADDYGAVLINNGNISCSVEKNTLNMMLFHTASFYGNKGKVTGADEFVPEKKTHIFTYMLYPHKESYREADVYCKAALYNEPLFAITQCAASDKKLLPAEYGFLKTEKGFEISAFKAGGYPLASLKDETKSAIERGVTLRGYDVSGIDREVHIKTGFDIKLAETSDLLEENRVKLAGGSKSLSLFAGAHSVETVAITPSQAFEYNGTVLGREKDDIEPTYVRSWEHDMGSVAVGYLKFAATLDKKPQVKDKTHTVINLNAVNNSLDTEAAVKISIKCSSELKADRKSVSVRLPAGESSVIPFTVTKKDEHTQGQIKIYYDYDGQTFTDVYEIGYFNPQVSLKIENGGIICTVTNTADQYLEGSLYIASPFETWGDIAQNVDSFGNVSPRFFGVELKPFEEKSYEFTVDFDVDRIDFFKSYYAAVKLCCNGRIHFAFADVHGKRHNVWAHEFINEINADNGSIKKLIEM